MPGITDSGYRESVRTLGCDQVMTIDIEFVALGFPTSNLDNTLLGVDFRYRNTKLSGGRTIEAEAWYQQSDTEGLDGRDAAWGLGLRMPNTSRLKRVKFTCRESASTAEKSVLTVSDPFNEGVSL